MVRKMLFTGFFFYDENVLCERIKKNSSFGPYFFLNGFEKRKEKNETK